MLFVFFQSKRPGGPAFNIFTHVLQREEERQKRDCRWGEGKSVKSVNVFLYLQGPNVLIRWEQGSKSLKMKTFFDSSHFYKELGKAYIFC